MSGPRDIHEPDIVEVPHSAILANTMGETFTRVDDENRAGDALPQSDNFLFRNTIRCIRVRIIVILPTVATVFVLMAAVNRQVPRLRLSQVGICAVHPLIRLFQRRVAARLSSRQVAVVIDPLANSLMARGA